MSVSAVYASIIQVPVARPGGDAVTFSNISATTAAFTLLGGTYAITVVGATFGSVTLQVLANDGTTWLTAATAITANGTASPVYLPPGSYKFALA